MSTPEEPGPDQRTDQGPDPDDMTPEEVARRPGAHVVTGHPITPDPPLPPPGW